MTRLETMEAGDEESAVSRLLSLSRWAEEAYEKLKSTLLTRMRVEGIV